jgi:hypothetical protein
MTNKKNALVATILANVLVLSQFKWALAEGQYEGDVPFTTPSSSNAHDISYWLQVTVNLLAAVAFTVFVISLIIAGYQYMTARDNASQVASAKDRIVTTVLTFALFVFGYAFLQWLVPGGIF